MIKDSKFTEISKVLGISWDQQKETFIYGFKEICDLAHLLPLLKKKFAKNPHNIWPFKNDTTHYD